MGRSHAWVPRGEERIAPRPINWGTTLTMIGAVRTTGWVTMRTMWQTANSERFVRWVRRHLVPHLRRDDIVVMDNLWAHRHRDVRRLIEQCGATVQFLPPYSPDFNPIEAGWALIKKRLRRVAPRSAVALRRCVHHARRAVTGRHCEGWYRHAGYCGQLN